jgi:hypothetical protein
MKDLPKQQMMELCQDYYQNNQDIQLLYSLRVNMKCVLDWQHDYNVHN